MQQLWSSKTELHKEDRLSLNKIQMDKPVKGQTYW